MNTKILSKRAYSVIEQYRQFSAGQNQAGVAETFSIPYFNNKTVKARGAFRAEIGKGSPKDIADELQTIAVKEKINIATMDADSIKKILVDNNIGIDCSGFAYYVLNAESEERGKGGLDRHLKFVQCKGLLGRMTCSMRPVENAGVLTFSSDKNSTMIPIDQVVPGDIITMVAATENGDRNHIIVIHQVDYQNFKPTIIYYSHAIAYPEDGLYGHGIKQGTIEISDSAKPITEQIWTEDGKTGQDNRLFSRAIQSTTELRRLKWL